MPDNDAHNLSSGSGVTPPGPVLPPIIDSPALPPPLPVAARSGLRPWAIAVICVVGAGALLGLGALMVGALIAGKIKAQRMERIHAAAAADAAVARRRMGERTGAVEARAFGSTEFPGVSYTNVTVRDVPWSIHVLKIDRSRKDLAFYSAHARNQVLGVGLLAEQARAVPRELGRAIAAVNGDFYVRDDPTYAGDPRGLQIVNSELFSAPDTVSVWFDADGHPHLDEVKADFQITWPDGRQTRFGLNQQRERGMAVLFTPAYGASTRGRGGRELILERDGDGSWLPLQAGQTNRARVRAVRNGGDTPLAPNTLVLSLGPELLATVPAVAPGAALQISTATAPDLKGARAAISGGPALIRDGKPFARTTPPPQAMHDYSQRSKYERHPRSAVGWSPTHVYLVTVDGRQPGLSMGMKLAELADFMADLGCTEAMNFDGGKSAQMWLNGRIMNSPCQGEDTVANSLLVIRKPGT